MSVMSHKTLSKRLNSKLSKVRDKIIIQLKNTSFVSTTADFWSVKRKSYLGITTHYIEMPPDDSTSVSRASVSLTCRRFYVVTLMTQ